MSAIKTHHLDEKEAAQREESHFMIYGKPNIRMIALRLIEIVDSTRKLSDQRHLRIDFISRGSGKNVSAVFFIKKGKNYDNRCLTVYEFSSQKEVEQLLNHTIAFCEGTVGLPAYT